MASILNIDENKIVFSLLDCEAEKICVELRQLDQRVGELGQLADHLDQGLKLGLSRPSTYLSGGYQHRFCCLYQHQCQFWHQQQHQHLYRNQHQHILRTGAMYDIYSVIPEEKRTLINSPVLLMKAIKNEVTQQMIIFKIQIQKQIQMQIQIQTKIQMQIQIKSKTGGGEWNDGSSRKGQRCALLLGGNDGAASWFLTIIHFIIYYLLFIIYYS